MLCALAPQMGPAASDLLPSSKASLTLLPVNSSYALPAQDPRSDTRSSGVHWSTLLVVRDQAADDPAAPAQVAFHFDSLAPSNAKAATEVLRAWQSIQAEATVTNASDRTDGLPKQVNGSDCGIWVLLVASRIVHACAERSFHDVAQSPQALIQSLDVSSLTPQVASHFRLALHCWLKMWADADPETRSACTHPSQVEAVIGEMPR